MAAETSYEYDFSNRRRGIALIMCNGEFHNLKQRSAASKDSKLLQESLSGLGFEVRLRSNLESYTMVKEVKRVARLDHSDADCVVVAVSSHGKVAEPELARRQRTTINVRAAGDIPQGMLHPTATQDLYTETYVTKDSVFGIDGAIPIADLMRPFYEENCASLAGKPKIFIFQSCRGGGLMDSVSIPQPSTGGGGATTGNVGGTPSTTLGVTSAGQYNAEYGTHTLDDETENWEEEEEEGEEGEEDEDEEDGEEEEDIIDAQPFVPSNAGNVGASNLPDVCSLHISGSASGSSQPPQPRRPKVSKLPPQITKICTRDIALRRDFISIHAVPPGYFAFSSPKGSPFIRYLCEELDNRPLVEDFATILRRVSLQAASKYKANIPSSATLNKRQFVPSVEDMLLREVYFRPKTATT